MVEPSAGRSKAGPASVARLQIPAGKLRPDPAAAMGRFGSIAVRPLYCSIAGKGGKLPAQGLPSFHWWSETLELLSPWLIKGWSAESPW